MMFWALLLGAMPLDPLGDPLPLYLDETRVRRALARIPEALSNCSAKDDLTVQVRMRLAGNGTMAVDTLNGTDSETSACITTAIAATNAPDHDGMDVEVKTAIYLRAGVWMMSPSPEIVRRSQVPLLLLSLIHI